MSDSNRGEKPNLGRIAAGILLGSLAVAAYWWMFYDMGASYTRYSFDSDQNSQSYAADAAQKIQNDCVGLAGGVDKKCLEEAIKASAEYQQGENDLEAQRGMSKWAFWLLVITSGQLFATIVGLVYLKGTLDATREAVEDTGLATTAMQEANKISNEMAESAHRLERAYVFVDPADNNLAEFRKGEADFCWPFSFTNQGKTPAIIKRIMAVVEVAENIPNEKIGYSTTEGPISSDAANFNFIGHFQLQDFLIGKTVILKSGEASPQVICPPAMFGRVMKSGQMKRFFDAVVRRSSGTGRMPGPLPGGVKEVRFWLKGRIQYEDIFGRPHHTNFCYIAQWPNGDALQINADNLDWNERT